MICYSWLSQSSGCSASPSYSLTLGSIVFVRTAILFSSGQALLGSLELSPPLLPRSFLNAPLFSTIGSYRCRLPGLISFRKWGTTPNFPTCCRNPPASACASEFGSLCWLSIARMLRSNGNSELLLCLWSLIPGEGSACFVSSYSSPSGLLSVRLLFWSLPVYPVLL